MTVSMEAGRGPNLTRIFIQGRVHLLVEDLAPLGARLAGGLGGGGWGVVEWGGRGECGWRGGVGGGGEGGGELRAVVRG